MATIARSGWSQLLALRPWVRVSEIGIELQHLADVLFKVENGKYVMCVPYDAAIQPLENDYSVAAVVWAETDGAARRAVLQQLEVDVEAQVVPPPEILLPEAAVRYDDVLHAAKSGMHGSVLEAAIYRVGDGRFVDRTIALPRWTFHFRGRHAKGVEPCYAVEYRFPRLSASASK